MKKTIPLVWIFYFAFMLVSNGHSEQVTSVFIMGIGQIEDDEEAPFELIASNKIHKCGGKRSNKFIVYSEDPITGHRRFLLALEAIKNNWPLSFETLGCEGDAMIVNAIRLLLQ